MALLLALRMIAAAGPPVRHRDDDQLLVSAVIKERLVPHDLLFFADGEAAKEFIKMTPPKPLLILCDTHLPRMNGIELRKRLNQNEYLRKKSIPFLFVTTAASPAIVQTAYEAMVQGYFRKLKTVEELKEQLRLMSTYWRECIHPNSDF